MAKHTIIGAVFLKAKCYALLLTPGSLCSEEDLKTNAQFTKRPDNLLEILKCKGVARSAVQSMHFNNYLNILHACNSISVGYNRLVSKRHVLHQTHEHKIALSALDDKRYSLSCGIHSLPYGHYKISKNLVCLCDRLG